MNAPPGVQDDAAPFSMSTAEAAARLAISSRHLRHLARSGIVPALVVRGRRGPEYRFRPEDIAAPLPGRRVRSAATTLAQRCTQLERELAEQTREITALLAVSSHIASTLELRPLLGRILDSMGAVIEHTGSSIYVVEDEWLVMLEHRFPPGTGPLPEWIRIPLASSHIWSSMQRNEPYVIDDLYGDSPEARAYRALWGERWDAIRPYSRSYLAMPLSHKDRPLGAIILGHNGLAYFTPRRQALVQAIANQAAIAIENARLYEQAREVAVLEERQRLSRELHDSVSQAVYSMALGTRTARTLLEREPARAIEPLGFVMEQAELALSELRALILELRPETIEREGLVATLKRQAEMLQSRQQIAVQIALGPEPALPPSIKDTLYRVAREALHNAAKHAQARTVSISLRDTGQEIIVQVQDDGRGFDPGGSYPGHLGLHSMRERLGRIGGTLRIESAAGRGTLIHAAVPYTSAE